ncbi:MAG TPA: hypothetical protein VFR19_04960 [Hyphomicrobiaceae bacterium]|nr:hypothetical protein [Hyphomicrobiaceae bacterium]
MVAPIIGAPDAVAKQIQQEFTNAIEKQRISVAVAKDERVDYTLRGYIVAAKDKQGTKVSYIWDVTDPTGKRVNRVTGEEMASAGGSKDPWAALTPTVAQSIAGKAANSFASWLATRGQSAVASAGAHPAGVGAQASAEAGQAEARAPAKQAVAAATPAPAAPAASASTTGSIGTDGPLAAVVPNVNGAPGDGGSSLASALQRELTGKGITVGGKSASAYRVEGTVTLGAAKEGKQPIQIEWLVRDPQGKKLGTVSQRNEIPEGSLDGPWGKTAEQAAGAAAQGILKLLPQKAVN